MFSETEENQYVRWWFNLYRPGNLSGWHIISMELGDGSTFRQKFGLGYLELYLDPILYYTTNFWSGISSLDSTWHYKANRLVSLIPGDHSVFVLRSTPKVIEKQVEQYRRPWYSIFGEAGGAFSLAAAVIVLLFGAKKASPWGIVRSLRLRQPVNRELTNEYVTRDGCPLVDPIPIHSTNPASPDDGSSLEVLVHTMRNRQEKLESLLSENYLDSEFLKKLKKKSEPNEMPWSEKDI
jgi:hypothetical protein